MSSEQLARQALKLLPEGLEKFQEFVGKGVVALDSAAKDGPMAVAVYVSKPASALSANLKAHIPVDIPVRVQGRVLRIPTKIVNVGSLVP